MTALTLLKHTANSRDFWESLLLVQKLNLPVHLYSFGKTILLLHLSVAIINNILWFIQK